MTTRREALIMIGVAPVGFGVAAQAGPLPGSMRVTKGLAFIPDRELQLTIGDDLRRQTWTYAGQIYAEERPFIVVNEDEQVRIVVVNDTNRTRALLFDGEQITLTPNATCRFELTFDQLQSKTLSDVHTGMARTIKVRPSYQGHALFAA